jgi:D-3-phosphoglycerate dehydrogenase
MIKILVADKIDSQTIEELKKYGQVVVKPSDIKKEIVDSSILIVRSATKVDKVLLEQAQRLKLVIRAGVGLDNIDLEECKKRSIAVFNTPFSSTNAVAELTIGLMICLLRKVCYLHKKLTIENKWEKENALGEEIASKKLGIIGMGRIGQAVAKKAADLGMQVYYYDKTDKNLKEFKYCQDLDELIESVDIITIHASVDKNSPKILDKERFSKIKKGTYLLNLSRGYAIDEKELQNALIDGRIVGAALDVFENEPYDGPLKKFDNVILTPHIGASTAQAQQKIGKEIIQIIKENRNIFE